MFFQGVGSADQSLRQKFKFLAPNGSQTILDVLLEYVAPDTLNEERANEQSRIIGQRKYNAVHDLAEEAQETLRAYNRILASRVIRIEGMTVLKLTQLVSVDLGRLKALGVKPADEVYMDPGDTTPLAPEERSRFGVPETVETRGQLAAANILYLVQGNSDFFNFVHQTIKDVSYFQNHTWWEEKQVKNSGTGADTNSAPRSATPPATASAA